MEATIFYILAATVVVATVFAITERHAVHAIVYLVTSFFALAVIFYLLGAPLVAVFEVIIYAGAIMVLFLFVIMMLDLGHPSRVVSPGWRDWWPAALLGGVLLASTALLCTAHSPSTHGGGVIGVQEFARSLFQQYGIAVEVISMQLLFALVGALYLGRRQ
jgi:NADH-quinone oxidoreductase subunit J